MLIKKIVLLLALVFVFHFGKCEVQAQTDARKFEVGVHYSTISLRAFDSTEAGGGVRLTYNINDHFAVEAEGNLFDFRIGDHPTNDFLGAQGFLGVKAGVRNRRIGVFAKLRPGAANFPTLKVHRGFCLPEQSCREAGRSGNRFALDTGAVLEIYPTKKIIVRIDVGDTMIHFSDDFFFKSSDLMRIKDGFSHNFQMTGGVGFRF